MSRIITNVNSLIASRILGQNNQALSTTLERLSTGYRINRGSDDPAGLIASENLRADKAALQGAIGNAERANSIVSTAEGALAEVSEKLIKLQDLVSQAASSGGLTQDEIDANQVQVDGILGSINRIASETSFQGMKLLNGSMGFHTTQTATKSNDVTVNACKGAETAARTVAVAVAVGDEATKADSGDTADVTATGTWRVTGALGSEVFTFTTGTTAAQIKTAIDAASAVTGLIVSGTVDLVSKKFGADQIVRVELLSGTGTGGLAANVGVAYGTDATVSVDNQAAAVDGYNVSLKTTTLDITLVMTDLLASGNDGVGETDSIVIEKAGGAKFQLSPNIGIGGQEIIGLNSVFTHDLGADEFGKLSDIATGQSENLTDDPGTAQNIVSAATKQMAGMRGRLGSFLSDTVGSAINSLQIAFENVSAAESAIRDTDFATETANMTRNQILVNAATSVLALANSAPQSVLNLL